MNVGFSGTEQGMTDEQKHEVTKLLLEYLPDQFHHGDCIGADAEAAQIVIDYLPFTWIVAHPGCNARGESPKRAYMYADTIFKTAPYLARNHAIVHVSDVMITCPPSKEPIQREGTWATIRYTVRRETPIRIIYPDGTKEEYFALQSNQIV